MFDKVPDLPAPRRRGIPLRVRLSLGSALRLTLAITTFGFIAYQQAKQTALESAAARARAAALSMSTRSGLGLRDVIITQTEVAAHPAVAEAFRTGRDSPQLRQALERIVADTLLTVGVALRKPSGELVLTNGPRVTNTAFDETQSRDSAGMGRLRASDSTLYYEVTAPVVHNGTVLGSLVRIRRVTASPASVRLVSDLMGADGAILFGNADNSLWTDLVKPIEGPADFSATRYHKDGRAFIVATRPIAGTPWVFAAEFPEAKVLAPMRKLIRNFTAIGGIIVLLGLIAGWWANARVTKPLTELTQAAEGITAGNRANPGPTPAATGGDELVRLQRAFQTMSDSVWQAREQLEGKVRDRTRALEDLKASEDALRLADRRKDEFLAMLAHELRNPLAPIRNAAQVIKVKNPTDPDLQWSRGVIERQVAQMSLLLDDLLDISRISHNRLELRLERIDVRTVLKSAIETSRPLIDASGHELTVTLPSSPVEIEADPVRLTQVFSNLLNNSAKYSTGPGHIRVSAIMHGSELVVTVADDGIGIAPDALPHVFQMFTQARPALNQSRSGLGIGLSLVRGLVALHGGAVTAESEGTGRGSVFTVRLPVVEPRTTPARGTETPAMEPVVSIGRRILIADDLADGVDSLAMLLQMMGHEVWTARDGIEALAAVEEHRPDIVLMDLGMPRMDGYEACRRMREAPWGQELLVVALTGWGQKEDRRRTAEAGFDHHLVKPVEPAALLRLIEGKVESQV